MLKFFCSSSFYFLSGAEANHLSPYDVDVPCPQVAAFNSNGKVDITSRTDTYGHRGSVATRWHQCYLYAILLTHINTHGGTLSKSGGRKYLAGGTDVCRNGR